MTTTHEELAELHGLARRVAARLATTPQDADDVAQEAVARAIASWDRISTYARPWTVRVVTNLSIAALRDRDRTRLIAVPDVDVDHARLGSELRLDLKTALEALPVRQRQAVVLRYLADFSEASVADLLGCSRGAVKRHLHRATTTLRESSALTRETTVVTEKEKRMNTPSWTESFVAANEPEAGWPTRPWDHWFIEGPNSSWDRVAVDADGEVILDADGDEVMDGPGFDHHVVKVVPGSEREGPPPRPDCPPSLEALLDRTAEHARFHGHPWVGDEHLALAVCEAGGFGDSVKVDELDHAIATFYDGPLAEARLEIVRARRSGQPFRQPPEGTVFWTQALTATLSNAVADAGDVTSPQDIASVLLAKEHSIASHLLGRRP